MKAFVLSLVVLGSQTVFAQKSGKPSRAMEARSSAEGPANLGYSLSPGRFALTVGLATVSSEVAVRYLGAKYTDTKVAGYVGVVQGVYGLMDSVELMARMNVIGAVKSDMKMGPASVSNGAKSSAENEGFGSPSFGVRKLVFDENSSKLFVSGTYASTLVKAKSSTSKAKGNLANSQSSLQLDVDYIRDLGGAQLAGRFARTQKQDGKSEDAEVGNETQRSGFHQTQLMGEFRKKTAGPIYWGASFAINMEEGGTSDSNGTKTDYDGGSSTQLTGHLGYEFRPDMVGSLQYTVSPASSKSVTQAGFKFDQETDQLNSLTATMIFVF